MRHILHEHLPGKHKSQNKEQKRVQKMHQGSSTKCEQTLSCTFVSPSHEKELAQFMANHRTIVKTKKHAEKGSEKTATIT